jgi:hypothetical protein
LNGEIMKIIGASLVMLFLVSLSNAAVAGSGDDKDGTKGTSAEPDCDYTLENVCCSMSLLLLKNGSGHR